MPVELRTVVERPLAVVAEMFVLRAAWVQVALTQVAADSFD